MEKFTIQQFAQTLEHHPIWKLNNSVSAVDDQIFGGVIMSQTSQYKTKLISTLSRDKGVKELYNMIDSRSNQHTNAQLANCLNNVSEGMLNNIKADESWKDVYLEILFKQTSINKDFLRHYYQTYHKVMSDGYLNYANILDEAFEKFEKSITRMKI